VVGISGSGAVWRPQVRRLALLLLSVAIYGFFPTVVRTTSHVPESAVTTVPLHSTVLPVTCRKTVRGNSGLFTKPKIGLPEPTRI
jgi:hypothetical protein